MTSHRQHRCWSLGAGTRTVAITEQVATLVDVDDRLLGERLWRAQLSDGADGALELLLRGGISAVPDFVLVEIEDDSFRVVIRGKARVVAVGDGGPTTYDGTDVRLAAEHLIADPIAIHVGFVDTLPHLAPSGSAATNDAVNLAETANANCAMVSGFGLANWIYVKVDTDTDGSTDQHRVDRSPIVEDETADDLSGASQTHRTAESTITVDPSTVDPSTVDPGTVEPGTIGPGTGIDGPGIDEAGTDRAGTDEVVTPDTADQSSTDESETSRARLEDAEPISGLDDDGDRYASIFGATMQRSVMDAAIRSAADGDDGIDAASVPITEGDSSPESVDVAPRAASPIGRRISVDTVPSTDLVDGHTLPPVDDAEPRQCAPARVDQGDHDGHTISRAELGSIGASVAGNDPSHPRWNVAGQGPEPQSGPTVQSVRCAQGHDNPPQRSDCGRCHLPLDAEPIAVPRPPLGTLTFSTGGEVILDRPILVGRKPDVAGLICSEIPREVAVDVGDGLSRSHALFSIAEWQVRVEDLGSTNHTTIRLPDQPARRLRAGEPVPITDGTLIDLGGEVTCRYDVNI